MPFKINQNSLLSVIFQGCFAPQTFNLIDPMEQRTLRNVNNYLNTNITLTYRHQGPML